MKMKISPYQYRKEPYGEIAQPIARMTVEEAIPLMDPKNQKHIKRLYKGKLDWELILNMPRRSVLGDYYMLRVTGPGADYEEETKKALATTWHTYTRGALGFALVTNGTAEKGGKHAGMYKNFLLRVPLLASHGSMDSLVAWTYGVSRYSIEYSKINRT